MYFRGPSMKYLVAGLGNPGPEYANSRHNIGFLTVEALARFFETGFVQERYADVARFRHKGRAFTLIKPQTFMNLSGKAVRYWMEKEGVAADGVLVITDDLALPFGKIRLRAGGGAGGHNGLANIIELLGTEAFPRLRFGIGHEFAKGKQVNYVLGEWSPQEQETLADHIEKAGKAVLQFGLIGIERAMNTCNQK